MRVRFRFPQCEPCDATVIDTLAEGKTLAVETDGHPPSLPALWISRSLCECRGCFRSAAVAPLEADGYCLRCQPKPPGDDVPGAPG